MSEILSETSESLNEVEQFYQTDFYSEDSVSTDHRKSRRYDPPPVDSGHHVLRKTLRFLKSKGKEDEDSVYVNKKVRIEFYSTNMNPGRLIRHAVSGYKMPHRVGTVDEDLYYSVILSDGTYGQTPLVLFFDSPEQYERTFFVELSQQTKANWESKRKYVSQN